MTPNCYKGRVMRLPHLRIANRRQFTISLQVFMILVAIVAVFCWYEIKMGPWKEHQSTADSFARQIPFWRGKAEQAA